MRLQIQEYNPSKESPKEPTKEPVKAVEPVEDFATSLYKFGDSVQLIDDGYAQELTKKNPNANKTYGFTESVKAGAKASVIGTRARALSAGVTLQYDTSGDPDDTIPIYYKPSSEEERSSLLKEANNDVSLLNFALENASTLEDVKKMISIGKENKDIEEIVANSDFTSSIGYALANTLSNPIDVAGMFIPALGSAKKAIAFANFVGTNVATGVVGSQANAKVTGVSNNFYMDALSIGLMSAGIKGLGHLRAKSLDMARDHDLMTKGLVDPESVSKFSRFYHSVATSVNDTRESITSGLPSLEVKQRLLDPYINPKLAKFKDNMDWFTSKITNFEQGVRIKDANGNVVKLHENLTSGDTAFSRLKHNNIKTRNNLDDILVIQKKAEELLKDVPSNQRRRMISNYFYDSIEGGRNLLVLADKYPASLRENKELNECVARVKKYYDERGIGLVQRGLLAEDNTLLGSYVPKGINRVAMSKFVESSGMNRSQVSDKVTNYLVEGVFQDADSYRWWVDDYKNFLKETAEKAGTNFNGKDAENMKISQADLEEYIRDHAKKDAWGYVDQSASFSSEFDPKNNSVNFLKRRGRWDWNYRDSSGFSLSDFREDFYDCTRNYGATSDGLFATMDTWGKDYKGMEEAIEDTYRKNLEMGMPEKKARDFAKNQKTLLKRLYGKRLSDAEYTNVDALAQIGNNIAYSVMSTWIGFMNYAEVSGALMGYGSKFLIEAIPPLRAMFSKGLSKKELEYVRDNTIGRELNQLFGFGEIMRQTAERFEGEGVNKFLIKALGVSKAVSEWSPGNLMQRASQDNIISAVQNCFISELARKAHGLGKDGHQGFLRDIDLERANLTKEQYEGALDILRRATYIDKKGKLHLNEDALEAFEGSPEGWMGYRKLVEYVMDNTIQRKGLDDVFVWERAKMSPILKTAMMFKTFALLSYNKRFTRMMNRAEQEGFGQFMEFLLASGLSTVNTYSRIYLHTAGMEEEEKENYLKNAIGVSSFSEVTTIDGLSKLAKIGLFERNPIFASGALVKGFFDDKMGFLRSSQGSRRFERDSETGSYISVPSLNLISQIPAANITQANIKGVVGAVNLLTNDDDMNYYQRKSTKYMIQSWLNTMCPDIPGFKNYLKRMMENALNNHLDLE